MWMANGLFSMVCPKGLVVDTGGLPKSDKAERTKRFTNLQSNPGDLIQSQIRYPLSHHFWQVPQHLKLAVLIANLLMYKISKQSYFF